MTSALVHFKELTRLPAPSLLDDQQVAVTTRLAVARVSTALHRCVEWERSFSKVDSRITWYRLRDGFVAGIVRHPDVRHSKGVAIPKRVNWVLGFLSAAAKQRVDPAVQILRGDGCGWRSIDRQVGYLSVKD